MTTLTAMAATAVAAAGATPAPSRPLAADRDGDKVFDRLEGRLAGKRADERLDVIVTLTAPASASRVDRIEAAVGGFPLKRRFSIVPAFWARVTRRQVEALARRPEVSHVEDNREVRAFNSSAQASFGVSKARVDAGVDGDDAGGSSTYSAGDLVAAVIDTGIHAGHPDLDGGKVIAFANCQAAVACLETPAFDDNGHGTHVAGTLAGDGEGDGRGVAPGAALVGVKVLDAAGNGTVAQVVAGIEWAVDNSDAHGIEAINLSLGDDACSDGDEIDARAANTAVDQGLVVAVAAGNSGPETCTVGALAAASKVITVGAMADTAAHLPEPLIGDVDPGFYQAFFSSRGPTADPPGPEQPRIKPDVSAPGVNITSANGHPVTRAADPYVEEDGTSMASPFAAGVALLMLDAAPTLTPQQVKDAIMQTAVDWGRGESNARPGTTGPDIDYGAGRLDAYAAIDAAGATIASPPAVPNHLLLEGSLSDQQVRDYPVQVDSTALPVAATLILPQVAEFGEGPDFDLFLLDPAGNEVATSERDAFFEHGRQEELGHLPATTGRYTVRVLAFAGSPAPDTDPFIVDVSGASPIQTGGGGSPPPSPPPGGAPPGGAPPGGVVADTIAPVSRFLVGRQLILPRRAIILRFRSNENVVATFSASIAVPGASRTFRLRRVRRFVPANRAVRVRIRVSRRVRTAVRRALRTRRVVRARLGVTAVDAGGNRSSASRRIRIRG